MNTTRPTTQLVQDVAAAALGGAVVVEPVGEGVSTYVYRLRRSAEAFYLRVLPEDGATFAPEVAAHAILRQHGVHVPEVIYWDDYNQLVGRSVMITTEIKGAAIGQSDLGAELPDILQAAGRDIAVLNRVPVQGFGWVRRDVPGDQGLRGKVPTEYEFMLADFDRFLDILDGTVLETRQTRLIRDVIADHIGLFDAAQANLAHGDFDVTHIFCHGGRYTGIIDLGEIRGTGPYYDLGHFRFHDGETLPVPLLPYLLEGYREVTALPAEADRRIALASLLIGVRFLARTYTRLAKHNRLHATTAIARDVMFFTAGPPATSTNSTGFMR